MANDISNQRFGRLVAIKPTAERKYESVVWECQCDCGNITYATHTVLSLYRKTSCGCSRYSNMENYILDVLSEYKINYIPQARFFDCKNIYPLPFDFYLYDYNTIIEFDGKQHSEPIEFFGGEENFAKI